MFAAACDTEQVRAALADAKRANVSHWGKCGEAKTIAQLVRRCRRLSAGSIPAAARSAAHDDSSPAPGRLGVNQSRPRQPANGQWCSADNGRASRRASPLARDGRPGNGRRSQPETHVEPDSGAGIRAGGRPVRPVITWHGPASPAMTPTVSGVTGARTPVTDRAAQNLNIDRNEAGRRCHR
jgi:hypothetical protein